MTKQEMILLCVRDTNSWTIDALQDYAEAKMEEWAIGCKTEELRQHCIAEGLMPDKTLPEGEWFQVSGRGKIMTYEEKYPYEIRPGDKVRVGDKTYNVGGIDRRMSTTKVGLLLEEVG